MVSKTRETERILASARRAYRFTRALLVVLVPLLALTSWGWYESLSQVWGPENRAASALAGAFIGLVLLSIAGIGSLVGLVFEVFRTHEVMVEAGYDYQDALDEAVEEMLT